MTAKYFRFLWFYLHCICAENVLIILTYSPFYCMFLIVILVNKLHTEIEGILLFFIHTFDSLVAQRVRSLPAMWETRVWSLGWEAPLEKEMATHCSTLAWKFHGRRSLAGYSSWGCKESDTTERLHFFTLFPDLQERNMFQESIYNI